MDGVVLDARRAAPVGAQGRFRIRGLEMGRYVVEVFEGTQLRHAEVVEVDAKRRGAELEISLNLPPGR